MTETIAPAILLWYKKNRRSLPWRNTRNPYAIWLSEVILQQTRVDQGTAYYLAFLKAFPDVKTLAGASERQVLKLWQGLGYYSRARNLREAARQIMTRHGGVFPPGYEDIIRLKGVGPYTAAAVASIAFGEPRAVLDGNVFRVLSRVFGVRDDIGTGAARKTFSRLAARLLGKNDPGEFNQAVMEFGALQCTPKNPSCGNCCLRRQCKAKLLGMVDSLPVKSAPPARRDRFFNYLVIGRQGRVFLSRRTGKDIWKGMYEFPMVESGRVLHSHRELPGIPEWPAGVYERDVRFLGVRDGKPHILSHQRINARFWELAANRSLRVPGWLSVGKKQLGKYPTCRLIESYLKGKF